MKTEEIKQMAEAKALEKYPKSSNAFIDKLYREAYSQAIIDNYKEQENNDGWISVEDRLPEEYETVLIWAEKSLFISTYTKNEWLLDLEILPIFEQSKITHWMPLPNPPKEK